MTPVAGVRWLRLRTRSLIKSYHIKSSLKQKPKHIVSPKCSHVRGPCYRSCLNYCHGFKGPAARQDGQTGFMSDLCDLDSCKTCANPFSNLFAKQKCLPKL